MNESSEESSSKPTDNPDSSGSPETNIEFVQSRTISTIKTNNNKQTGCNIVAEVMVKNGSYTRGEPIWQPPCAIHSPISEKTIKEDVQSLISERSGSISNNTIDKRIRDMKREGVLVEAGNDKYLIDINYIRTPSLATHSRYFEAIRWCKNKYHDIKPRNYLSAYSGCVMGCTFFIVLLLSLTDTMAIVDYIDRGKILFTYIFAFITWRLSIKMNTSISHPA